MQVDIGIITIREDEHRAILQRFPLTPYTSERKHSYGIGHIQTVTGATCVVAVVRASEQGNDVAQQVAQNMIIDLEPQLLLVVGIAGGVPHEDFTLGDVVISTRIHNFDVNALKEDTTTFAVAGGIHPYVADITGNLPLYEASRMKDWNQSAVALKPSPLNPAQIVFDGNPSPAWQEKITESIAVHFSMSPFRDPVFTTGSIASSNSLIRKSAILVDWLQTARTIRAVEMEAAGVYQAAQHISQQYPVMAIRGISDIVGLKRERAWTTYACHTAAAFTFAFVKAGIVASRDATPVAAKPADQPEKEDTVAEDAGPAPLNLFICYAAQDEEFKSELEAHLTMLRRERIIRPWHSQQLGPSPITTKIDQSQIILLLVSRSFLASDDLYEQQMLRAMQRRKSDTVCVVPILVRSVDITNTPFHGLIALPRNGQAVANWPDRDEAWAMIARELRELCNKLRNGER